jgi:NitT/TauT family transport system permease protein
MMNKAISSSAAPQKQARDRASKTQQGQVLHILRLAAPPLIVLGVFVVIWYIVSYLVLSPERRFLLPPPHQVVAVAFGDATNRAELFNGLFVTFSVSMTGLVLAIFLGVSVAFVMSQERWLERSFYPYAVILQTIPILAIVPLIGLWFGFEFTSRVIVCVLIALFPIITNTLFGLKSVDPSLHDLFTLQHVNRWTRFLKLQLPAALPAMFTGFRISAGLVVIGAIVGGFFFRRGEADLGILLDSYRAQLRTEELFGAIFLSSLLGLAVFWIFGWMGSRVTRTWHASADQPQ